MKEILKDLYHGHTTVAGKRLLFIRTAAMQHMFGDESITKYHDAVHYFRESLNIRAWQAAEYGGHDAGSGRPDGHQQMCNVLRDTPFAFWYTYSLCLHASQPCIG